jgi:hypothetical protein
VLTLSAKGLNLIVRGAPISGPVESRFRRLGGREQSTMTGGPRQFIFPRLGWIADELASLRDVTSDDSTKLILEGRGFSFVDRGQDRHPSWGTLYPHQRNAIDFLCSTDLPGSLIPLSPGMGKGAVGVIAADLLDANNVLIIAPTWLQSVWVRESKRWVGRDVNPARGEPPKLGWNVCNYESITHHQKWYMRKWDLVILDESVLVKNRDTARYKKLKGLRPFIKRLWCFSGSPTTRFIDDLWSQFSLCWPQGWTSYWRFADRFCEIEETVWGKGVIDTKDDIDMSIDFREMIYVMNQDEVLTLPEFIWDDYGCELLPPQRAAYDQLRDHFITELETSLVEISASNKMSQLIRLQQVTSNLSNVGGPDVSGKLDVLMQLIETGNVPTPSIIWVHWSGSALSIAKRFADRNLKFELATGSTEGVDEAVDRFKAGEIDYLIFSLGVGKFGHTMTNTQSMMFFDLTWDMDAYFQALHRVRRIGLDHRPKIIRIRADDSTDQLVDTNLSGKAPSIAKVTNADLARILRGLKPKGDLHAEGSQIAIRHRYGSSPTSGTD